MTRPRLAALALLLAACGDRGTTSDAKITLRYHPPAGAVYRYALEQHHTMNMESGPLAGMGAQQITMRMHFTQAVTGPVAGGVEVHLTFDSTQMELPGVPPQLIAAQLARARGLHSTVLFDERLQIIRTDGPAPDLSPELAAQMGAGVKAVAMALPEQPVGRGDSWTVATDLPLGQLPGMPDQSASRTTLTVQEIRVAAGDTTVLLGVEVTFPGAPTQIDLQGQKATVRLSGRLSGDQIFSLTRGAVVGGTLKGTMRMNVTGGMLGPQGMTLSSATESTLRLSP